MWKINFIILTIIFSSCDIFETRDPEKPNTPRTNWIPATTPALLLSNLKNAINDKSTENYLTCFVDSTLTGKTFTFIPTSESFTLFPALFSNWTIANEKSYFENIKSKLKENASFYLSYFNENEGTITGDSLTYSSDYTIYLDHGIFDIPKEYQGHLQFTLIRNSRGEWAISFWKDSRLNEFATWSELKGRFSY